MKEEIEKQFEEVYAKYENYIFQLLLRFTNNRELAEDLKQESFLRIFKSFHSFNPATGSFLSWASKIAKNIFYRHMESGKVKSETPETVPFDIEDTSQNTELAYEKKILSDEIKNLISCLNEPERSIVIYKHQENLTLDEIALRLKISRRTVSRKYLVALNQIKETILKKNLEL